jgi:UV DNA damage repair endonuclease
MSKYDYRISACCQLGELVKNRKGETVFEQYKDCTMGTVQRAAMLKILGIAKEDLHLLTKEVVLSNKLVLQAKLIPVIKRNLQALRSQLTRVSKFPTTQRIFRISSDLLPLYTHPELSHLYDEKVMKMISISLAGSGNLVKKFDIRVSTHPSQYTTLCSDNDAVIDNSIRDLEYHVMMFENMGLTHEDGIVINIHANGASFELPERARHLFKYITLENDEKKAGHEKTLMLCEKYGIRYVFDHHHHFCESGEYIDVNGETWKRIKATWNGQRPLMHLSQSRGTENFKELCAHSDTITDENLIRHIIPFLQEADVDVEAKYKNVASDNLDKAINKILNS